MIDLKIPRIHEPEYDDPKEVYAFFGLAAFYAQCFEQSMILLLLAVNLRRPKALQSKGRDELLKWFDKKSLGALITELKKVANVEVTLQKRLEDLLEKRNFLMHHFFPKNSMKTATDQGRRDVLDELRSLAQTFQDGDHLLVSIYEPLWEKMGMTQEMIEHGLRQIMAGEELTPPPGLSAR
jgi:hypothetical protein